MPRLVSLRLAVARCVLLAGVLCLPNPARSGAFETYGDVARVAIPAIAFAASMAKRDYEGAVQFGLTSATTMGVTHGLKVAVDRERPNGGDQSFPSGHTAAAFMGASYLHFRYGWKYGLPAYAAATAVAVSRVDVDEHHTTDVVAGALIAVVSAYVFTDTIDDSVSLVPFVHLGKKNFGITVKLGF